MAHSLVLFAQRVLAIMFFTGLTGCATVVVISWISIFKDGFSDLKNKENESHWENSQHTAPLTGRSRTAPASLGRAEI